MALVNADPESVAAARGWRGDFGVVIEAEPGKLQEHFVAWVRPEDGRVAELRVLVDPDDLDELEPEYRIRAPYSVWKGLLHGSVDPVEAVLKRRRSRWTGTCSPSWSGCGTRASRTACCRSWRPSSSTSENRWRRSGGELSRQQALGVSQKAMERLMARREAGACGSPGRWGGCSGARRRSTAGQEELMHAFQLAAKSDFGKVGKSSPRSSGGLRELEEKLDWLLKPAPGD